MYAMEPTKRIILNTTVQYVKAIVTTILSLFSMRIILEAIGISDYGIFSVVGGIIAMLGFITNALVVTTQRYISYYYGRHRLNYVKTFFINSFFLHILLGLGLGVILLAAKEWLMCDFLNIAPDRVETAKTVYDITVGILFITVITAPFKAVFIARENIVYISIVEMADAAMKFVLAFSLLYIDADKLLIYALILAGIQLLNFFAFVIYGCMKFVECTLRIRRQDISKVYLGQLLGFAGWTTYGTGAVAARNQGTAIILNHFFGTTVNAAYGIAYQIFGAISFVSTSILNAMNPQIMKAEGTKDRRKVFALAEKESKYSTMLLLIVLVPLMFEMPSILTVWLKEVPPYSTLFCNTVLLSFICDQMTAGLNTVNQAMGKIKVYTLLMYTPKLAYLIIILVLFKCGGTIMESMVIYAAIELMVSLSRIPYLRITAQMSIQSYFCHVLLPLLPLAIVTSAVCGGCLLLFNFKFRFLLTAILSLAVSMGVSWTIVLNTKERKYFTEQVVKRIVRRIGA